MGSHPKGGTARPVGGDAFPATQRIARMESTAGGEKKINPSHATHAWGAYGMPTGIVDNRAEKEVIRSKEVTSEACIGKNVTIMLP